MRLLLLAAILVTASACDSGGPEFTGMDGLSQDASLLVGTWQWERSYGCGDGSRGCVEQTPRSTGRTETLTFSADGTVSGFFNGSTLVPVAPQRYRVTEYDVVVDNSWNAGFGVSRDRLVLTTAPRDGEETTYRRAR